MKNAKTIRRRYLRVLLCTLLSALTGCLDAVVGDVDICTVNGKGYSLNESFPAPDGCNTCTCMADGSSACTEKACLNDGGAGGGGGGQCSYAGKTWKVGDRFSDTDGCNTCSCLSSGDVACTLIGCSSGCTDGKNTYKPGETYQPGGCGSCTCQADGSSICLAIACAPSCKDEYGKTHQPGETFASPDGCNSCSCGSDGNVSCTDVACGGTGTCTFNGQTYKEGETFTDALGCNGCGCNNGSVVCDAKYCDPAQACSKGEAKFASGTSVICEDGCNTCLCNDTSWSSTDSGCLPLQKVESCSGAKGVEKVRVLYRDGDKLAVEVGTGGCATDRPAFKLCFDGAFRESYPVQATLNLIPTTVTPCSAWVTQSKVFDLSPLRSAYQMGYQSQTGTINVSLDGTGFQYSF